MTEQVQRENFDSNLTLHCSSIQWPIYVLIGEGMSKLKCTNVLGLEGMSHEI